jgi:hypothetical protein
MCPARNRLCVPFCGANLGLHTHDPPCVSPLHWGLWRCHFSFSRIYEPGGPPGILPGGPFKKGGLIDWKRELVISTRSTPKVAERSLSGVGKKKAAPGYSAHTQHGHVNETANCLNIGVQRPCRRRNVSLGSRPPPGRAPAQERQKQL